MSSPVLPLKRKYSNDTFSCIVCGLSCNIVEKPKIESFLTIKQAALRRKDSVAQRFAQQYDDTLVEQKFSWHASCYASYTSEQKIRRAEILFAKNCSDNNSEIVASSHDIESVSSTKKEKLTRSSVPQSENETCLICDKQSKKKVYKTFLLSEYDAAHKFLSAAHIKMDTVFTKISTCDTVESFLARKVRYHVACMKEYTYITKDSSDSGKTLEC